MEIVLRAWWQAWTTEPGSPGVNDVPPADLGEGPYYQSKAEAGLVVRVEGALVTALIGLPDQGDGGLGAHIEAAALTDLESRLLDIKIEMLQPMSVIERLPQDLSDPRFGACRVDIGLGGATLSIWVGQALAARWAPRPTARREQLSTRREAVGAERLRMTAQLDLGEIALTELHNLREGDVIATHALLNTPVVISLAGRHPPLIHGRLGEQGGRRACLLLGVETLESIP